MPGTPSAFAAQAGRASLQDQPADVEACLIEAFARTDEEVFQAKIARETGAVDGGGGSGGKTMAVAGVCLRVRHVHAHSKHMCARAVTHTHAHLLLLLPRPGSTAVVALVSKHHIWVANCGAC